LRAITKSIVGKSKMQKTASFHVTVLANRNHEIVKNYGESSKNRWVKLKDK
jgi:hypothetical protein